MYTKVYIYICIYIYLFMYKLVVDLFVLAIAGVWER